MTVASWPGDQSNGTGAYENGVHEALLADPSKLTHPIKEVADKYELLPAFLKVCATVFAVKEYACMHRITCLYEISETNMQQPVRRSIKAWCTLCRCEDW